MWHSGSREDLQQQLLTTQTQKIVYMFVTYFQSHAVPFPLSSSDFQVGRGSLGHLRQWKESWKAGSKKSKNRNATADKALGILQVCCGVVCDIVPSVIPNMRTFCNLQFFFFSLKYAIFFKVFFPSVTSGILVMLLNKLKLHTVHCSKYL